MNVMEDSATNQAKNRSRGVVVFDNGTSIAATRLSPPLSELSNSRMQSNIRLDAAPPTIVASRFGMLVFAFLAAMVLYWIGVMVGTSYLLREKLGQETANIAGVVVASIVVPICGYLYAAYVCKAVSRFSLDVDNHGFRVTAMRLPGFTTKEFEFFNTDVERVVYGQKLSGMERFLDRLDELGVPRTSQHIAKDLKRGRLFVVCRDGERFDFQFLDKAFDDNQLLKVFSALDENDVAIDHGG